MRRALIILITLFASATAEAAPRRLTLTDVVQRVLKLDPVVAEAGLQRERARVGVLRAQLDRGQLKVDGSVQELWQKTNIGGSPQYTCSDPAVPSYFCGAAFPVAIDNRASMLTFGGTPTTMGVPQSPSQTLGLSNFQAQLSYFLFSGLRVEANVKRAKLASEAALTQIRQQRRDAALVAARAFWSVRRLESLRAVQKAALDRMIEAERVADGRVRAGVAPVIDRNRATQRRLAQAATLGDLDGQLAVARAQLGVMLDLGGDDFELVDDKPVSETLPATPAELVCEALSRRPEVKAARLQAEVQHQQVVMARAAFFPQLTLFGLFQYGNNQLDVGTGARSVGGDAANPFVGMSGNFTAGASVTVNLFDTLNTYTSVADASYQERVLHEEVRRYERLVDSDVRTAYANLGRLYQRRAPLVATRNVAAENLTIVQARYKNGDALVIEYLDAQIELANAELNLADVTAQLEEQWLELRAALGAIVGVDHG